VWFIQWENKLTGRWGNEICSSVFFDIYDFGLEAARTDWAALNGVRLRLKCDGVCAETGFRLSAKRTGSFKSAGSLVQSTTDSRGVRISGCNGSNAGYTMFCGSVKSTGYPFHSPVSPSLPLPWVTVRHHISTGLYTFQQLKLLNNFFTDILLGSFMSMNNTKYI